MNDRISLTPYISEVDRIPPFRWTGQVTEVVGLLIESRGPSAAIGDFCEVTTANGRRIRTQVIGFRNGRVLAMPLEERRERHELLMKTIRRFDVHWWCETFLSVLDKTQAEEKGTPWLRL